MPDKDFEIDMASLAAENRNAVRAPEANEMLERTPSWLLSWGLLSIVLVFGIMLVVSVMVNYPDTVEGNAILTTFPFPARVVAPQSARIARLFQPDGARVQKNSPLAELENNLGYDSVLKLEHRINSIRKHRQAHDRPALAALVAGLPAAGPVQPLYNDLAYLIREENLNDQPAKAAHTKKEREIAAAISSTLQALDDYLQSWRKRYLLVAPCAGTVQQARLLHPNELTSPGEELFVILPAGHRYMALVTLPAAGIGKISPGQPVHLLLANFPYNEYGFLEGRILKRSTFPETPKSADPGQGPVYQVYVSLPGALVTSFHDTLTFSPEMTATARVITKDRNLLQRLVAGIARGHK